MNAPADSLNATIARRIDVTDQHMIVHIKPDAGRVPEFEPGQFVNLALPDPKPIDPNSPRARRGKGLRMVRRSYSIASSPDVHETVELFLVRVPVGKLTPRLFKLRESDRLWMDDQCAGSFTLDAVPRQANVIMIATGTGVAPFVSMLRHHRNRGRWRKLALIDCCRLARDMAYHDELHAIADGDPDITYTPCATREPSDAPWPGFRGRVQALMDAPDFERRLGFTLDCTTCHVMLCGNPGMIDDVSARLVTHGFTISDMNQPGNVHFERYW